MLCMGSDVLFRLGYRQPHLQPFRSSFALRGMVDMVSRRTMRLIVTPEPHRIRLIGQLVRTLPPVPTGVCYGSIRAEVLASAPGFSLFLDVWRPGDALKSILRGGVRGIPSAQPTTRWLRATLLGKMPNMSSICCKCSTLGSRYPAPRSCPAATVRRGPATCLGQRRRAAGQPAAQRLDPDFSLRSVSDANGWT